MGARERKGKERKGKEGKGRERKGKEGKGRERMGKEGKRKGKEGKGMSGKRSRWRSASLAARTAADGVGAGNGWGEEAAGDERAWLRGRLRTGNGCWVRNCADGCGRRGCNGVAGNGWGEEAAGDERAWLRGRLRTAWVPVSGWKWVGRRSRWRSASLAARTAADGNGVAGNGWENWSGKLVGRRSRW